MKTVSSVSARDSQKTKPISVNIITMAKKCDSVTHSITQRKVIKLVVIIMYKMHLNEMCPI